MATLTLHIDSAPLHQDLSALAPDIGDLVEFGVDLVNLFRGVAAFDVDRLGTMGTGHCLIVPRIRKADVERAVASGAFNRDFVKHDSAP